MRAMCQPSNWSPAKRALALAPRRVKERALRALGAGSAAHVAGAPAPPAALAPPGGGMHPRMQDLVDAHVPLLAGDKVKMG